MILPGMGSVMAGLSKSAPVPRGSVQSSAQASWLNGDWSPDLAAHEAGDVLVVFIAAYSSEAGLSFDVSSGWTAVVGPSVSSTTALRVIKRTAVSSATTLTITKSGSDSGSVAVHSYACRFAHGDVANSWTTASRDPSSLTPSWGSENNLWIAANLTTGTLPASGPTDFANGVQTTSGDVKLSTMDRSIETPTLDPSAFQGTAGATDITIALAVRPA